MYYLQILIICVISKIFQDLCCYCKIQYPQTVCAHSSFILFEDDLYFSVYFYYVICGFPQDPPPPTFYFHHLMLANTVLSETFLSTMKNTNQISKCPFCGKMYDSTYMFLNRKPGIRIRGRVCWFGEFSGCSGRLAALSKLLKHPSPVLAFTHCNWVSHVDKCFTKLRLAHTCTL